MPYPHDARSPANPFRPEAPGFCDRCGRKWFHRDLDWQFDWRGNQLTNLRILVCPECLDTPQENGRRPVILPADPEPIQDPRPGFQTQQEGPPPPVRSVRQFAPD